MSEHDAQIAAAFDARNLQDFARGGRFTRQAGRIIPFLNPGVIGLQRQAQAWRRYPGRTAVRWILLALLPKVAEWFWAHAHGDEEELREQPDYLRDMFASFKAAPNTWIRIPLGWEAAVGASGVTRMMDLAAGRRDAMGGYAGSAATAILPVDESALVGPFRGLIEARANYDMFRGRQIVPWFEAGKPLDKRAGAQYASRIGHLLQVSTGIDGRYWDHIIEAQAGNLGRTATRLSDTGKPRPLATWLDEATGMVVPSPGTSAKSVQEAMRLISQGGQGASAIGRQLRAARARVYEARSERDRDTAARELRMAARRAIELLSGRQL